MTVLKYLALCFWLISSGGLGWYILKQATEITYVTLADGRKQARALPLLFKILLPFVPNLNRLTHHPSMKKSVETANWQLVAAGFEGLLTGYEFIALKLLIPCVGGIVWFVILQLFTLIESLVLDSPADALIISNNWGLFLSIGILALWVHPLAWLRQALKKRHKSILRALPFVLDLLTLSVEAGMDFISALQRNCKHRKLDPLNEELIRMICEIQIGTTRKEALHNIATRIRLPELKSICTALIQADDLGVSIGAILRIQSAQMRQQRFERAEKLANEAPTKMLGPLLLFIFPATIIMLLGPIISQVLKSMV